MKLDGCKKPAVGVIGLTGQSVFLSMPDLPKAGETVLCDSLHLESGGKGHNQAIACTKMGVPAVFVGTVGDDAWGHSCCLALSEAGVTPALTVCPEEKTAYAAICVDHNGNNHVSCYVGAGMSLRPKDIAEAAPLRECGILLTQLEISDQCVYEVLQLGQSHGIPVILNPAPARPLPKELLEGFYALTPNEHEAKMLFGIAADGGNCAGLASRIIDMGLKRVAVTLGGKGVLLVEDKHVEIIPPLPVENLVDTTGAGDIFNGTLAARLAEGAEFSEAVRFAVAASGLSVCKKGAAGSIPTRTQVDIYC